MGPSPTCSITRQGDKVLSYRGLCLLFGNTEVGCGTKLRERSTRHIADNDNLSLTGEVPPTSSAAPTHPHLALDAPLLSSPQAHHNLRVDSKYHPLTETKTKKQSLQVQSLGSDLQCSQPVRGQAKANRDTYTASYRDLLLRSTWTNSRQPWTWMVSLA